MPVRPLRDELRRIPTVRNVVTVVMALVQTFGVVIAAAWSRHVVVVAPRVRADGPWPLPAQHPRPRGRPPPAVPEPPGQRLRRPLAARVPDVPGVRRLPAGPLRPPPRRARPRGARHRAVSRLPDRRPTRGTASCAATSSAISAYKNFKGLYFSLRKRSVEARQILAVQVVLLGASIAFVRPFGLPRVDRLVVARCGSSPTGCGRSPSTAGWSARRIAGARPT